MDQLTSSRLRLLRTLRITGSWVAVGLLAANYRATPAGYRSP
ncbi:MAG: hypothetical protein ACK6A5_04815 [Flavobacteriales bacterium]